MADLIRGAQVMKPECGTQPSVYYRNIPGQFIAGTVYDPEEEEVLIGAVVRLQTGGKRYRVETDKFGDFWFKGPGGGQVQLVHRLPRDMRPRYSRIWTLWSVLIWGTFP